MQGKSIWGLHWTCYGMFKRGAKVGKAMDMGDSRTRGIKGQKGRVACERFAGQYAHLAMPRTTRPAQRTYFLIKLLL